MQGIVGEVGDLGEDGKPGESVIYSDTDSVVCNNYKQIIIITNYNYYNYILFVIHYEINS